MNATKPPKISLPGPPKTPPKINFRKLSKNHPVTIVKSTPELEINTKFKNPQQPQ
jgi:hypothetical protein